MPVLLVSAGIFLYTKIKNRESNEEKRSTKSADSDHFINGSL